MQQKINQELGKYVKTFDNTEVYAYELVPEDKPKAIVQIIHGMNEHAGRYLDFAKYLVSEGYVVWANDLRAFGKTSSSVKKLGKYSENCFYDNIRDQIYFSDRLKEKYNVPLFVLGHSYGSFLTQRYIELYQGHTAFILSGSANMRFNFDTILGKAIADFEIMFKGKDSDANLISNLSFVKYTKKFNDGDWLTSCPENRKIRKKDPYHNKVSSNNFYKSFFSGLQDIYKSGNLQKINVKKPSFLFSGDLDPVGKNGRKVRSLQKLYKSLGAKNCKLKLYANGRHEMLNEINKLEVWANVNKFINSVLEAKKKKEEKLKNDNK